jgi:GSCFA family
VNPYEQLDSRYFWSSAVAKKNMFDIDELWSPKFNITQRSKVVTYGSCFAQHIGRALQKKGFAWHVTETAPKGLKEETAKTFNYGVFSARTGNIYTVSLLKQWAQWAVGEAKPPAEVWQKEGRFYDPFRPAIEPNGFDSEEDLLQSREVTIEAFKRGVMEASVFVFTLGLTESWVNAHAGHEYPMCPGTVAGEFDPQSHEFRNQGFAFIRATLVQAIHLLRKLNPRLKFLLTVSPVPLTATMSGNHVLVATMESKAVLRAVAGELSRAMRFVDYFPSYEIINAPPFRGSFFEPNQRNVNHAGVDHVMGSFFRCLMAKFPDVGDSKATASARQQAQARRSARIAKAVKPSTASSDDEVCEELLLNAFADKSKGA